MSATTAHQLLVLDALQQHGPLSPAGVELATGLDEGVVRDALWSLAADRLVSPAQWMAGPSSVTGEAA